MAKKKFSLQDMSDYDRATVLRGFARQIDKMALPRIEQVKKIAEGVGLVLLTAEEAEAFINATGEATKEAEETLRLSTIALDIDQDALKRIRMAIAHPTWVPEHRLDVIRKILLETVTVPES